MDAIRNLFRLPTAIFTFEDFVYENYDYSDVIAAADQDSNDEPSARNSSDEGCSDASTTRPSHSIGSNESASETSSELAGLSNRQRNQSSMTLMALARSGGSRSKIAVPSQATSEEEIDLCELDEKRKEEKWDLCTMRKRVQDTIQLYETWQWFNPRLEELLANDQMDPATAVAQAREKNATFLRDTMDDVKDCADLLLGQIKIIGVAQHFVARKLRDYEHYPLFKRTKRFMDLLGQLCETRYKMEQEKIKEKQCIRAQTRQDSIYE